LWQSTRPLEHVLEPTGAGDSFGGGLMGYLDQLGSHDPGELIVAWFESSVRR
jgi:sugar/nucleoside kinase (ribokinase family)